MNNKERLIELKKLKDSLLEYGKRRYYPITQEDWDTQRE